MCLQRVQLIATRVSWRERTRGVCLTDALTDSPRTRTRLAQVSSSSSSHSRAGFSRGQTPTCLGLGASTASIQSVLSVVVVLFTIGTFVTDLFCLLTYFVYTGWFVY